MGVNSCTFFTFGGMEFGGFARNFLMLNFKIIKFFILKNRKLIWCEAPSNNFIWNVTLPLKLRLLMQREGRFATKGRDVPAKRQHSELLSKKSRPIFFFFEVKIGFSNINSQMRERCPCHRKCAWKTRYCSPSRKKRKFAVRCRSYLWGILSVYSSLCSVRVRQEGRKSGDSCG